MSEIRVIKGGRERHLDVTKSIKAAAEGKFYKAGPIGTNKTSSGTLKVSGIKTYLEKYPNLYYVFHPQHRVVGTWEQLVQYDSEMLNFQRQDDFNNWLMNRDTLIILMNYIDGYKQQGYNKEQIAQEIKKQNVPMYDEFYRGMLRETTRDKIDVTKPYNPFKNLVAMAVSLNHSSDVSPKLLPVLLSDLIEKHKGTAHRAGTLTEKIANLPEDKCLDVTGIDPATKTGARTRPKPKHSGKKESAYIPRLVSGTLEGYSNAMLILQAEGYDRNVINSAYNDVARKFSGTSYSPVASPRSPQLPTLELSSPVHSPTRSPDLLTFSPPRTPRRSSPRQSSPGLSFA